MALRISPSPCSPPLQSLQAPSSPKGCRFLPLSQRMGQCRKPRLSTELHLGERMGLGPHASGEGCAHTPQQWVRGASTLSVAPWGLRSWTALISQITFDSTLDEQLNYQRSHLSLLSYIQWNIEKKRIQALGDNLDVIRKNSQSLAWPCNLLS